MVVEGPTGGKIESFGSYLRKLLEMGQRPVMRPVASNKWSIADFANAVDRSTRQVENWLKNRSLPENFDIFDNALFGRNGKDLENRKILFELWVHTRKHSPKENQYSRLSVVEIFWENLFEIVPELRSASYLSSENIDDAAGIIAKYGGKSTAESLVLCSKARSDAFDRKYGEWNINDDERHRAGIEGWTSEIKNLLGSINVEIETSELIVVGIGCGLEGIEVYNRFMSFVGVDISNKNIRKCMETFKPSGSSKINKFLVRSAEDLYGITEEFDVYISLKTYQSTFFDIRKAVRESARVVRSGGKVIISIPRKYYFGETIIYGMARTNYNYSLCKSISPYSFPDILYPFEIINNIIRNLARVPFEEIMLYTGIHEHYIIATKK